MLWIDDDVKLPELKQLSLKSMLLTGHEVTLYSYAPLENVPSGIKVTDANQWINQIFSVIDRVLIKDHILV